MAESIEVKHERELREQWEREHQHVHELEKEARNIAFAASNQRLDVMNQFREQINSERAGYISRENFEAVTSSIDTRLKLLETKGSFLDGKMWVVGAVVTLVGLFLYFIGKH
jgi:hypothetical protein